MSKEYNEYLNEHKGNVAKAFYWIRDNLPDLLNGSTFSNIDFDYERQITAEHDKSKSDFDEYGPYDDYFYGANPSYETKQEFNKAWIKHIHKNPHHWQYWVLHNDDPREGMIILDMPYNYILEMICDWWSFSFKINKLDEIFNWYNQHKNYILLSDLTKKNVEVILQKIYDKLVLEGEIINENINIHS